MNKLIAALMAALFATVTVSAFAADDAKAGTEQAAPKVKKAKKKAKAAAEQAAPAADAAKK